MIVLDKVFRQKDSGFLRLLNELRRGIVSQDTITTLKRKVEDNKVKEKALKSSGFVKSSVLGAVTTGTGTGTGGGGEGEGKEEMIVRPTKLYATNRLHPNLPFLPSFLSFPSFFPPFFPLHSFPLLFHPFVSFLFPPFPFPTLNTLSSISPFSFLSFPFTPFLSTSVSSISPHPSMEYDQSSALSCHMVHSLLSSTTSIFFFCFCSLLT